MPSLLKGARKVLDDLGYTQVVTRLSDGTSGWSEEAPFDAILVTAGAPDISQAFVDQLTLGGRLVLPVGDRSTQILKRVVKTDTDRVETSLISSVFVPLVGKWGWRDEKVGGDAP